MLEDNLSYKRSRLLNSSAIGACAICCVALISVFYLYSATKSNLEIQYNLELQEFQSFLFKYNKQYPSESEFYNRLKIFRDNLAYIRFFNSQHQTWVLGVNKFADLTPQEFKENYKRKLNPITPTEYAEINLSAAIPSQIDWSTKGAVTPVGNQGQCGSPYAWSGVGAIEGAWFIAGHPLVALSTQEVVDCSGAYGNEGCNGGLMTQTFQFVEKYGLTSAAIYPSTGTQANCIVAKEKKIVATISSYANVTPNSPLALETALARQPVSVAVESDQNAWEFYKGGIISSGCGTELDHAIVAVGYDLINVPPYYKCKNSWGTDWGEAGYVRIAIVAGPGVCGIQMEASYPII